MTTRRNGRAALRVLAGLGILVLCAVVANALTRGRPLLALTHELQVRLGRWAKAVTIDVPRVGRLRMFLHPHDAVITPWMMAKGVWEPNDTHWMVLSVRPGQVVVDLGANVGYYTLVASRLVGAEGRVYAFEPDPVVFAILERNVRLSGARNVVLEQKAVSNQPGSLELFIASENKGDDRIYQPKGENRPSVTVEAVRLDDYFRGRENRVDFVKIDTQGAEGVILEGMRDLIRANDDIVMEVEYWPFGLAGLGSDDKAVIALLRSFDFRFFDLGPGVGGVQPIPEIDDALLQQKYTVANKTFTNLLLLKRQGHMQPNALPATSLVRR